jgi:ribulose-phosphate 3-epimerase
MNASRHVDIIPTNTCPSDLTELAQRTASLAAFASQVQLDICDGVFAPTISWPYHEGQWDELESMAAARRPLPLGGTVRYEAHLMVQDPLRIGELLARMGCPRILAHVEAFADASATRDACAVWKAAGASEVGIALLIDTPLSALDPLVQDVDEVLLMAIPTIGAQGAPFDERVFARIAQVRARHPDLLVAIDGGVSLTNIAGLSAAGVSRFGVGSAISKALDPSSAYAALVSAASAV